MNRTRPKLPDSLPELEALMLELRAGPEAEYRRVHHKHWRIKNAEHLSAWRSAYIREHAEETKRSKDAWETRNPEKVAANVKHHNTKPGSKAYKTRKAAESRARDPERPRRNYRRYYHANLPRVRKRKAAYKKEYHAKNPSAKLAAMLRRRINAALGSLRKSAKSAHLVGCTWDEFRVHLEALFLPGMTWDNYGKKGWEVDHIKPCAKFDLTDPAQQHSCFHYSNTQPLWGTENRQKSAKFEPLTLKQAA